MRTEIKHPFAKEGIRTAEVKTHYWDSDEECVYADLKCPYCKAEFTGISEKDGRFIKCDWCNNILRVSL